MLRCSLWTATQMRALDDLVKAGYVRYIGMSSCHAYQCTRDPPPLSFLSPPRY